MRREGKSNCVKIKVLSLSAEHDEVRTEDIVAADDQIGAEVTLVSVEE